MTGTARARRAATWALLVASLAGAAAFVVLRAALPSDGGRIPFYGQPWTPTGVVIEPIDPPAAGLQAGDVVERIDGRSMEQWLTLVLDTAAARPSDGSIPYGLTRDDAPIELPVDWAPPAVGEALAQGWSIVLFSVAIAGLAAFVLYRRPQVPAASALALAASGAAGSSLPWFLGTTTSGVVQGGPFVLHAALTAGLYMILWPAAIHLALVFPEPFPLVRRRPAVVPAVYLLILGAYAAAMVAAALTAPTRLEWVARWSTIQLAIVVPTLLAGLALFVVQYRRVAEPTARARMRLAALGAAMSGALGLVLFMGPKLLLGSSPVPDAAIGLIALPLPAGFAAAIVRDRLFDIDAAINRTLVYGGLTLGVVATYLAVVTVVRSALGAQQDYAGALLATGLAALVALPLRDVLQRGVDRLMYGDRGDPWRALHRLGTRLEWAADPSLALPAIAETVAEALRLPYVAVEVFDEVGRTIVAAERGSEPRRVESLALVHGGEPVGRLVLGVRSGETGFRADETALLEDLARHAGAAVHAQRLRDELAVSRARLVATREEERRRLRRDLHDGLGPALAAIGMRAETAGELLSRDPQGAREQLDALAGETRDALLDIRRLVDGLRPPALDELGLVGAIGSQASRLDGAHDATGSTTLPGAADTTPSRADGTLAIAVDCEPDPLPELPAAVEVAAYRIAVEALTNAIRHAGATACRIHLAAGSQLTIEVIDDGRGLAEPSRRGTGLESMRERALELGGDLLVERRAEGGTRVVARLPLARRAPA